MGLMSQMQDDAERLVRQDKNAQRNYLHDSRTIKAEAAPHEAAVKEYNTQVEGFKNSAVKVGPDELWSILGWVSGGTAYQPVKYNGITQQYAYAPEASSVKVPGVGIYKGSGSSGQLYAGWYNYGDSPTATVRDSSGQAIAGRSFGDIYSPTAMYASWNDRPFVAPITEAQTAAAKTSNDTLGALGEQASARTAEYDKTAGLIGSRADRLALDSEMLQNRAREEPQVGVGPSVFAQNTNVFQSISDWLK